MVLIVRQGGTQAKRRTLFTLDKDRFQWDCPHAFHLPVTVHAEHTDVMGHTNNVQYLRWLEDCAWAHSQSLGLDWAAYQQHGAAVVARRHEVDYLAETLPGDSLTVATWVSENAGKARMSRRYQIIRHRDGRTVLRGLTHWAVVRLSDGRPIRMPDRFREAYVACGCGPS